MAGSYKSVYQNLAQSFQYLLNAKDQSNGLDAKLGNRLESLLSDFEALFEFMIKDKSDEGMEALDPPAVVPGELRTFGEVIRHYRKNKGMSRQELADTVNVSRATIAQYEANRYTPPAWIYNKLLSALEIIPSGLLEQVPPPRTNADRVREMMDLLEELKDQL